MKKIISTFISVAVLSVVSLVSVSVQSYGTRVEAKIPFDFVVGKQTFKAGNYELSIFGRNIGLYSVSLKDEAGRNVYSTFALRSYKALPKDSRMEFAVVDGEHFLQSIKTPDIGYAFTQSKTSKAVAQVKQVSVPVTGASPQF